LPNGRLWNRLALQSKIMLLYGIQSGVALGAAVSGNTSIIPELSVEGFRFSEVAAEVDAFYRERANIKVPVPFAYHFVVKKMKGASPAELSSFAAQLRRHAGQ